jgi:hypothetical protein
MFGNAGLEGFKLRSLRIDQPVANKGWIDQGGVERHHVISTSELLT